MVSTKHLILLIAIHWGRLRDEPLIANWVTAALRSASTFCVRRGNGYLRRDEIKKLAGGLYAYPLSFSQLRHNGLAAPLHR